jgi:hypothetical protein
MENEQQNLILYPCYLQCYSFMIKVKEFLRKLMERINRHMKVYALCSSHYT